MAADASPRAQPPPLSLLREGQPLGSGRPHYLLLERLRPRASANDVQKQDLADSGEPNERFNEEGVWESIALGQPLPLPKSQDFSEGAKVKKRKLWDSSGQEGLYAATANRRSDSKKNVHKRQKRYTIKQKLRSIAVPLSVFNFLGFLPVRVPGLPYHDELPSPDYGQYETKYDVYVPRYRRRKTFRRF